MILMVTGARSSSPWVKRQEDDGKVYIFDENGLPINDGDVTGGSQLLGDEDTGFLADWKDNQFYRLPPISSYMGSGGGGGGGGSSSGGDEQTCIASSCRRRPLWK